MVAAGNAQIQLRQVFDNLAKVLGSAHSDLKQVAGTGLGGHRITIDMIAASK